MGIESNDISYNAQDLDLNNEPVPSATSLWNVEEFLGASHSYPGGSTFMGQFSSDQYSEICKEILFYLFTSQQDWKIALWLLHSCLSMVAINSFL